MLETWERAPADRPVGVLEAGAYLRHQLDRYEPPQDFPFIYVPAIADKAVALFSLFRHYQGELAGQRLELEPWQEFIIRNLYGWRHRETMLRRFHNAFISLARKNGKTFTLSGVGITEMVFNYGHGPQVYTAATKLDQARLIHRDAMAIIAQSPALKKIFEIRPGSDLIRMPGDIGARYMPLANDSKTQDGFNVQCGLCDEIHEHKDSSMWDVLDTGTVGRAEPLMAGITTAGIDLSSMCGDYREIGIKLADPNSDFRDDSWFSFICERDEGDDWRDESTWGKANPNLGVSVKIENLRQKALRAREIPRQEMSFRRKNLNEWVQSVSRWISLETWDAAPDLPIPWAERFAGRRCWGGCDLSARRDMSSLVLAFPFDQLVYLIPFYWIPEDCIEQRERLERLQYRQWSKLRNPAGYSVIEHTPGNIIDHDFILARLVELAAVVQIEEIAYDPFTATQFGVKGLEAGLPMVEHRQGALSMHEPCVTFESMIEARQIVHGGNPVLRWNVGNLHIVTNSNGLIRPTKPPLQGRKGFNEKARIDGAVSGIMAIGRWKVATAPAPGSVYLERGLRTL